MLETVWPNKIFIAATTLVESCGPLVKIHWGKHTIKWGVAGIKTTLPLSNQEDGLGFLGVWVISIFLCTARATANDYQINWKRGLIFDEKILKIKQKKKTVTHTLGKFIYISKHGINEEFVIRVIFYFGGSFLPLRQSKAFYKFGFFDGVFGDFQKKTTNLQHV